MKSCRRPLWWMNRVCISPPHEKCGYSQNEHEYRDNVGSDVSHGAFSTPIVIRKISCPKQALPPVIVPHPGLLVVRGFTANYFKSRLPFFARRRFCRLLCTITNSITTKRASTKTISELELKMYPRSRFNRDNFTISFASTRNHAATQQIFIQRGIWTGRIAEFRRQG